MPKESRKSYSFRARPSRWKKAEANCEKKKETLREQLELRVEEIAADPKTIKKTSDA